MKKISILMFVVFVLALVSCKKTPTVNQTSVVIRNEKVTVDSAKVSFRCIIDYDYPLEGAYLYYGEDKDNTDMSIMEMEIIQDTLKAELSDLKESTTYNYCYEFVNGFNSMRTDLKSFKTH